MKFFKQGGWRAFLLVAWFCLLPLAVTGQAEDLLREGIDANRHPRLFVTSEELPALREKLQTQPFKQKWGAFLEFAEECLERKPANNGSSLLYSREGLGLAGTTAFAYLISRDRRYGERAKKELEAMLSAESWRNADEWRFNRGADLVTGERCLAAALVYDWCYDLFTDAERREYAEGIVRLGIDPYLESLEKGDWWVRSPVSNWCGVANGGCGVAALALAPHSERAAEAEALAWEHTPQFLRDAVLKDGGGHEGVMYWRYGVSYALRYLTAAARLRGDDKGLYDILNDRMAGYWDVYLHAPDGKYANFNDMMEFTFRSYYKAKFVNPSGGASAALAALFESLAPGGDPLLLWAADNGGTVFMFEGGEPFTFLWRRQMPPAGPKPELQDSVLFRGVGHALMRSPSLWFIMNGGVTTRGGHYNHDLGSFMLVAGEERFVSDPGYGFRATGDHSTVVFDGKSQPRGASGDFLRFGEAEGFSWAACDLSKVNPKRPVERWVRQAVMVRGEYIVLVDDIETSRTCDLEWRLQSRRQILAEAGDDSASIIGKSLDLDVVTAWPRRDVVGSPDRKSVKMSTLSIRESEPRLETRFVVVLYPRVKGEKSPAVEADGDGNLAVTIEGRRDHLEFERRENGWMLKAVNGESAAGIPDGTKRSLRRVSASGPESR
ncbi:MAG: heparinase II/III domain-containing protein [Candidatus Sumerlaeota bacterium]